MTRPMTPHMTIEERNEQCAAMGHPGVTYNPWLNRTWCICGERIQDGDQATHGIACCGGPLDRWKRAP